MVRHLVPRLPALPVCLAVVQLLSPCSAQFAVVGPPEPILAMVGEDAELPCHLSPEMSAETMELTWERPSPRQVVHTYAHGQEDTPAAEYRGRTSILREDITVGKAALQILDIRASDRGTYLCYFQDGDFYAKAQVELKVSALGGGPWRDPAGFAGGGRLLPVATAQEDPGPVPGEGEGAKRERRFFFCVFPEKLQDKLRWTRIPYLPREERSQAYAELKMALFQPADVFLDPDTAHPTLRVSEDKRSLQRADTWQNLPDNPGRFCGNECVLGCESFTSGRHFWEVEVGDRAQWCVGVCREDVRRKGGDQMAPKSGFWTVGLNPGKHYLALTNPQTPLTCVSPPERVGVFLDCELGEVSFYNALDGSHIFTFPHTRFSGPLRPVFWILTFEPTPLTICPAQKPVGMTRVSDPVSDPILETVVVLGSAAGIGDSPTEASSLLQPSSLPVRAFLPAKHHSQKILNKTH
ncbi:butyrophilin subfamily 3 member A3-like isoform X1 [Phyllostomus hastatus]|uniref:butyrophilin subfamily 3 member A3-like isoform X1 n=1 Tax=Phyllostomus hastatus TaxID=9423 RepID=UPI001E6833E1|nr:butyrophilin subfamily 3 member A3-like isoform X1 [Phyllostomus hastatus]